MSKPDTWMPMFVADYAADTTRLTLEQHGAYLLLIFDYWRNGPPPDDDETIARILGVERRAWLKLRPAVVRFFRIEGGHWRHKRVDAELKGATERSEKAEAKARAAADARWAKARGDDASGNACSMLVASAKHAPSMSSSNALHSSPVSEPSSETEKIIQLPVNGDAVRPKATRLPKGWKPSDDDEAYAMSQGMYGPRLEREIEDFRDYWHAKSGKDAAKLDWPATWRRWVRTALEKKPNTAGARKQVDWC